MFTIPFVLILSVTGTIYLFKPQIEAWQEREFDRLQPTETTTSFDIQINAAVAAVEGGTFDALEILPPREDGAGSASRVLLRSKGQTVRVFVDPSTASVLGSMVDDERLANFAKRIHGELMLGQRFGWPNQLLVLMATSGLVLLSCSGTVLWWRRRSIGVLGAVCATRQRTSELAVPTRIDVNTRWLSSIFAAVWAIADCRTAYGTLGTFSNSNSTIVARLGIRLWTVATADSQRRHDLA